MGKMYVLGSLNTDLIYYVEQLPGKGMTISARASTRAPGGKGLNQAFSAAWSGVQTALIGAVGSDANGTRMLEVLRESGIETSYVERSGAPSGTAVILVDGKGDNLIVVDGGANLAVTVRPVVFQAGDLLAAQLETNLDAVLAYFRMAKEAGARVALNPSPYREVPGEIRDLVDLFILNEHEASALIQKPVSNGAQVAAAKEDFVRAGVETAVITLGSEGAVVLEKGEIFLVPGIPVQTVDTQGAGDAFAGVLFGGLLQGLSLREAAERANRTAARCVEVAGSTLVSLKALKG